MGAECPLPGFPTGGIAPWGVERLVAVQRISVDGRDGVGVVVELAGGVAEAGIQHFGGREADFMAASRSRGFPQGGRGFAPLKGCYLGTLR